MFNRVVQALLKGDFICPVTWADGAAWLDDPIHFDDVESYLFRIDRKLLRTRDGGLFYVAYINPTADDRLVIKKNFEAIRDSLKPIIMSFDLYAGLRQGGGFPQAGDFLRFGDLAQAVTRNSAFLENLKEIVVASQKTGAKLESDAAALLHRLIRYLKDEGYLCVHDQENLIFKFTGKIDYLNEIFDFLIDQEKIVVDVEDSEPDNKNSMQGVLL